MNRAETLFSFLSKPNVMKIMKYMNKTPKTTAQISKETKIPIATTYRLISRLEGNKYLKGITDSKIKVGPPRQKYRRGIIYKIIITPDGVKIING